MRADLVADELLRALEHEPLGLLDREAGDALELCQLGVLRRLQLLLKLLQVRLAIGNPCSRRSMLGQLAVDLLFLRDDPLLDLDDLGALVLELVLDLGAELERLLARLDLRLAANRLGATIGVRR